MLVVEWFSIHVEFTIDCNIQHMYNNMNNITQGFPILQKDQYRVYVRSITYNQAPYIEDCLNGVAMQQTDFPFVHHIIDDASTDGEQEIIKAWIEKNCDLETAEYYDNDFTKITLAKIKSNSNCTLAAYFLKRNLHKEKAAKQALFTPWREVCPYEALCEGDDYWIDPLKLQKQVDFMDKHPEFGLVFSNVNCVDVVLGKMEPRIFKNELNAISSINRYIIDSCWISPCTWLYRSKAIDVSCLPSGFFSGDMAYVFSTLTKSKIGHIPDVTSDYRILSCSASHFDSKEKALKFLVEQSKTKCFYSKYVPFFVKIKLLLQLIHKTRAFYISKNECNLLKYIRINLQFAYLMFIWRH